MIDGRVRVNLPRRMICALTPCLCVLAARPIAAQAIRARVIDSVRRTPIVGALVELQPGDGGTMLRMFTSPSGAFVFTTVASQRYRLRIAAIGYARHPLIDVAASTDVVKLSDVILTPIAVTLPELHAMTGKRACGKSEVTPETFGGLLDGAQTALQVMHATMDSRQVAFEVQLIHTITMRKVRDSSMSADTSGASVHEWPVRSLSLDSLRLVGFARNGTPAEGGGQFFYGPDLEVLFSDWFLESHCFTLDKKRSRDDTVFIRFDPARKSKLVDVGGELVLNRRTLTLERLTYAHRNLPDGIPDGAAGGIMRFRLLSEGLWVPADWAIWAPIVRTTRVVSRPTTIYVRGPGGRTIAQTAPPQPPAQLIRVVGRDERRGRLIRVLSAPGP
jgi:hypothetical protein